MPSEEKNAPAIDQDPSGKNWDYVITGLDAHDASHTQGDYDDIDIPQPILWDLAGGNIDMADHGRQDDLIDILLLDMSGREGATPDMSAPMDTAPGVVMSMYHAVPVSAAGTDTISDFTDDAGLEVEMPQEPWFDVI